MKLTKKLLGIAAIIAVIGFLALPLTGCPEEPSGGGGGSSSSSDDTGEPINNVSISIPVPKKDDSPVTTISLSLTDNFTTENIIWSPAVTGNKFAGGQVYTASVTLTAEAGFTFKELTKENAKINGQVVTTLTNNGKTVILTYTFPATDTRTVNGITITTQPSKTTYNHNEQLNLTGIVVTVTYDEGAASMESLANFASKGITTEPVNGATLSVAANNGQPLTVRLGSNSDTTTLTVNPIDPTVEDFTITGIGDIAYDGSPKQVTINSGITGMGNVTVYYTGTGSTSYARSTTAPANVGTYNVTFDVAAGTNYKAKTDLSAGTLSIILYFNSIESLKTWLTNQTDNDPGTAYAVKLDVNNFGGDYYTEGSLGKVLSDNSNKYIRLDLSGCTFTAIEDNAFLLCRNLVGVTLPTNSNFTSIGEGVFCLTGLTSIAIPNNVTNIGEGAFSSSALTSVTLPTSSDFTSIGAGVFSSCINLTNITIPNNVTNIGEGAFSSSGLISVTIPNSVINIERNAFLGCKGLGTVTFQGSSTSIGETAFAGYDNLANAYASGKAGTYTASDPSMTWSAVWTKQY